MGITTRKRYPNRVARRKVSGVGSSSRLVRRTPIGAVMTGGSTTTATLSFDQAVILSGVPQYLSSNGDLPTSAAFVGGPLAVILNYPTGASITNVTIPFEDPAIRNASGGYVNAGNYTLEV